MLRAVTEQDKKARRDAILDAAMHVFAEKGYREATIADVARVAELSYGSIYVYFDSKQDLFLALMRRVEDGLIERIDEARGVSDNASGSNAFVAAVAATLDYFEVNQAVTKLMFRDALSLDPKFGMQLEQFHSQWTKTLAEEFAAAQKLGLIRAGDPYSMALASSGLISQFAMRRITTDDGMTTDQAAAFIVDFILTGLIPR